MAFRFILVLWNKWNIRCFLMLSLWLQVFLILFAPLRKKTANRAIRVLLWLAYLMADWVVAFSIGLISHSQSNSSTCAAEVDGALTAFWASFLLLHLGGPDTITAFSMEDSSLWRRHLLSLVFQVSSTIYVFMQIFPRDKSLVIPTMLVFLAGLIKNVERMAALSFSSLLKFREWVFLRRHYPNYVTSNFVRASNEEVPLAESVVVKHAYYFLQTFTVLLGDLMFTDSERTESRIYFEKVFAMDALRVISIELQFMYEMLHTKMLVVRFKKSYIFRFIAFTNVVMAFIWFNRLKKHQLPKLDVEITYSLIYGGIALDVITMWMLIFSDWTSVGVSFVNKFVAYMKDLKSPQFVTCEAQPNAEVTYTALDTPLIFRRWSESISACNLLSELSQKSPRKMWKCSQCSGVIHNECWGILRNRWRGIIRVIRLICDPCCGIIAIPFRWAKNLICCCLFIPLILYFTIFRYAFTPTEPIPRIVNTKYVSNNPFINELWIFIFMEVRRKSKGANDEAKVKQIFEAKGDLFLMENGHEKLIDYVTKDNYDTNIIIWHIATEMWYNKEKLDGRNDNRESSKILSDYMMYLLLNQPNLVSTVAGVAQVRSACTLRDMRKVYHTKDIEVEKVFDHLYMLSLEELGKEGLDEGSTLCQGIKLAKEIKNLGQGKWKVMSGVWVEMLSFAAVHVKGETHAQVLSKGGELLTFVWLLMAHFGCLYDPEWGICMNYGGLNLIDNTQDNEPII